MSLREPSSRVLRPILTCFAIDVPDLESAITPIYHTFANWEQPVSRNLP